MLKMKNLLYTILLFPLVSFSQYVDMWHFSVPYNETNIYEATEKEWFAKVMSKAAKEGLIRGWGMSKRFGKEESNVSYITWISFGDINSRKEAYKSIGKYVRSLYVSHIDEDGDTVFLRVGLMQVPSENSKSSTGNIEIFPTKIRYLKKNK